MSSTEKTDTNIKLQQAYWDARLLDGKVPASVYALCKTAEIEEGEFYEHFASLAALEGAFWRSTVTETIEVLHGDDDFMHYDFQQKLLAFYYTYFTHIQQYRSRFVDCFPKMSLDGMKSLKGMRAEFCEFAQAILEQGKAEEVIADRKKLNQLYDQGLFEQFRALILFYRHDDSEKFQDTDALIEKSVAFVIEGMRSGVLESAFDMVRFLMRKSPFLNK